MHGRNLAIKNHGLFSWLAKSCTYVMKARDGRSVKIPYSFFVIKSLTLYMQKYCMTQGQTISYCMTGNTEDIQQ